MSDSAPFDLGEAVQVLEATPAALRALLAPLGASWTDEREGPEGWSPREIVAHLVQGEREDWIPRARRLLEHGERLPFEAFDRSGHLAEASEVSMAKLLDSFADLRRANLEELGALAPGPRELDCTGAHPALGPVTLRQLLATWTVHDLAHLAQVARVMARRYGDEVGPWGDPAYLRVLNR